MNRDSVERGATARGAHVSARVTFESTANLATVEDLARQAVADALHEVRRRLAIREAVATELALRSDG